MLAFHQTKASKWNNLDVVHGMEEFVDVLVVVLCVVMECYLHPAHVNDSSQAVIPKSQFHWLTSY
jgi:hypothetical protein